MLTRNPAGALIMAAPLADVAHPLLYEINTWPWLEAIRAREGRNVELGSVPDRYWDEIADPDSTQYGMAGAGMAVAAGWSW
jgi:hypothetical protein